MKSLFIISTASQAFFLSLTPELVNNSILILTVKEEEEAEKILGYIGGLGWGKKLTWYIPRKNSKTEYVKFLKLRFQIQKFRNSQPDVDEIYFGSYINQYHRSLLAEFEKKSKLFLLYDGLQIISTAYMRTQASCPPIKHPMLMRLLGFKVPVLRNLNYISPIALDIPVNDSLHLIKSSEILRHKYYDPEIMYFIGQPISSVGVLKKGFYLDTLKKLKSSYRKKKLIYIPHPREKEEDLGSIAKIVEIMKPDIVFEKFFLLSTRFPQKVFSFYSSVLLNLIFLGAESEIISIEIPPSEIELKDFARRVDPIYTYFQTIPAENFKVVDIKNLPC